MAIISDYVSLKTAIQTWCARSDTTFSNQIETFIALAETRMENGQGDDAGGALSCEGLVVAKKEAVVALVISNGTAAVPADATSLRTLRFPGDRSGTGIEFMSPRQFALYDNVSSGAQPARYTIEADVIRMSPAFTGVVEIVYYKQFPAITSSNTTNAILTMFPMVYLTSCLFEAFTFTQDVDLAAGWFAKYKAIVSGINNSENSVRFGGGPLRVRTRNPIP
jgi:hypothetical protein